MENVATSTIAEAKDEKPEPVGFVPDTEFTPPPEAKAAAPAPEEPKRGPGRPPLTPEEKAARDARKSVKDRFGDLFYKDEPLPEQPEGEGIPITGAPPPPADSTPAGKRPGKQRQSREEYEALAEIILLNQYGIVGLLFDPVEANPLARLNGQIIQPQGQEMHERMRFAYAEYFRIKDISAIDPGLVLIGVNTAYLANVVSQPRSSVKMKRYLGAVVGWVKSKFQR